MKSAVACTLAGALFVLGCGGERIGPGASGAGGATSEGGDGSTAATWPSGDEGGAAPWSPTDCQVQGAEEVLCFEAGLAALAIDSAGAFLIAGGFEQSLEWGSSVLEGPEEEYRPFVGKLDANKQPVWANAYLAPDDGYVRDIVTDAQGNSYVTGTATRVEKPGEQTTYLAKLSPDGALVWRKIFEPYPNAYGYGAALAVAPSGEVLLLGTGKIDVDPYDFGHPDYPVYGSGENFAVAFDADGKALWEHWLGQGSNFARAAAATADGGFLVSVESYGTFGMTKLAPTGEILWEFQVEGWGDFSSLTVDEDGSIRAAGSFSGPIDLGGVVTQSNSWGIVAAQLDQDGNLVWGFANGSDEGLVLHGSALLTTGELLLVSELDEDVSDVFGEQKVAGGRDIWTGFLDGDGEPQQAKTYGGVHDEFSGDVALDGAGLPWLVGSIAVNPDSHRSMLMRFLP